MIAWWKGLFAAILIAQAVSSCSLQGVGAGAAIGTLLVNGQQSPSVSFTGFTTSGTQQSVPVTQTGNITQNGVTIDASGCAGIAGVNESAMSVPGTLTITAEAIGGPCTINVQSGLNGATVPVAVTVSGAGPTPTPSPTPGALTVSPTSASYSAFNAGQTFTASQPNYTGSFSVDSATGPCASYLTHDGIGNGPSASVNLSAVKNGSCNLTFGGYNGSTVVVPIAIATPTPAPTSSPTSTPSPGSCGPAYLEGNWGGNSFQGGPANGSVTIPHTSGDGNWMPSETLVAVFNCSLTAAEKAVPSPFPSAGGTPVPGVVSIRITGASPPPGTTDAPANQDSGYCYGNGGATRCTADGTTYDGTHWVTMNPYPIGAGSTTRYNVGFSHATPCEMYSIQMNAPDGTSSTEQFEYNAVGATPCPGSSATPLPMPTPCVAPGTWSTYIATAVSPASSPNPCPSPATTHVQDGAMYLTHLTTDSVGDLACSGSPLTCIMHTDSLQNLAQNEAAGMGALKQEFTMNNLWGNGYGGTSGKAANYNSPNFAPYDAIYTNALTYGQTVIPALDEYSAGSTYEVGGNAPAIRQEVYAHFCGQVAAHAAAYWPHVDEMVMGNEPDTGSWGAFPLQGYVVSGGQAGTSSVTIQLQNGTTIPNSGSSVPMPSAPDGSRIMFVDGPTFTRTESFSYPKGTTPMAVTSLGNGEYTLTLPSGVTFAQNHALDAPVALNTDGSGYSAGLSYLMCYSAIKAAAPSITVLGPEGKAQWAGPQLAAMMSVGCETGTCWDIYTAHLQNWSCMCAPSASNGESGYGDWQNWYSAQSVLTAHGDPAAIAGTLKYADDEWGYTKAIFDPGHGVDLLYQAWLYAQSLNAMWSGGRTVAWGYQGMGACYRCWSSTSAPSGYTANFCGPPGLTAAEGSNWGWGSTGGKSNSYYASYGGTDLTEHGAMDTGCSTGDGSIAGQAPAPALAIVKQFNCAFFNAASCSDTSLAAWGLASTLSSATLSATLPDSRVGAVILPEPLLAGVGFACGIVSSNAYCETFNYSAGSIGTLTQIDAHGSGTNIHNWPGGGWLAGGADSIVLVNSYASTDSNNKCLNGSGAPGTAKTCQEANVGNTIGGGTAFTDLSAAGSHLYLPTTPISEPKCFGAGSYLTTLPANISAYTVCGGQLQLNPGQTGFTSQNAGAFGFVTLHPVYDASGLLIQHLNADVSNGSGGLTTQDLLSTAASSLYTGTEEVTQNVHSDVALRVGPITESGSGTGGFTLTLPAVGANGPWACVFSAATTNVVSTDVPNFVSAMNSGSALTGTGCGSGGSVHTYYHFDAVANTTDNACASANTCIYVELKTGDPRSLGTISVGTLTGTISAATSYAAATNTSGANFNFMEWATLVGNSDGSFNIIMPTMNGTSAASGALGSQIFALNRAIFWTAGPVNGIYTICDVTRCADGWSTTVSPITAVADLLGGGAGATCTGYPYCTAKPTVYTSATGTASAPYYIVNATSANRPSTMAQCTWDYANMDLASSLGNGACTWDRAYGAYNQIDGDYDLVDVCANTSGVWQLCFHRISATSGLPVNEAFIESGFSSVNYAPLDVKVFERSTGQIVVVYTNDECANDPGGSGTGGCVMEYVSSDNTGTSWTRSNLYAGTGYSTNGAAFISAEDELGIHGTFGTIEQSLTGGSTCSSGCALKMLDFAP